MPHNAEVQWKESRRERYRGLRGVVRRVLPGLHKYGIPSFDRRDSVSGWSPHSYGRNVSRRCIWCNEAIDERRQVWWHRSCSKWYARMSGRTRSTHGWVIDPTPCPCGADGVHLDHIIPIGLAALHGVRAYVRAFFPENLQWLCEPCHKQKTANDLRAIADAKAGRLRLFDN